MFFFLLQVTVIHRSQSLDAAGASGAPAGGKSWQEEDEEDGYEVIQPEVSIPAAASLAPISNTTPRKVRATNVIVLESGLEQAWFNE